MTLVLTVLIILLAGLLAPAYIVLMLVFPLQCLGDAWQVGGIWVGPTELVVAALAMLYLVRRGQWQIWVPYHRTWVFLFALLCVSYVLSPQNQQHMTDPVRAVYQLYRYCLTWIIWLPLATILLNDRRRRLHAVMLIIVAGDIWALDATIKGYSTGTLGQHGNWLAGSLIAPFVLALGLALFPTSRAQRVFGIGSAMLLARAILFAGSRGGFIGVAVALLFTFVLLLRSSVTRSKLTQFLGVAVLAGLLLLVVKPDLMERPTIVRLRTVTRPMDESTLHWRMEERWPHFLNIAMDNFWFGVGEVADSSLGVSGNTPHNGFLAIAVSRGTPALLIVLLFAYRGVRDGVVCYRDHTIALATRVRPLFVSASIVGLLVHNLAETTLTLPFVGSLFWLVCGVNAGTLRDHRQRAIRRRSASDQ